MSFRHSTQLINTLISAQNNVGSIPLHGSINSLIVTNELSARVYYKLAKQFKLTQYSSGMNMSGFDAAFIDCRGTEISCPFQSSTDAPDITVALVDENSYLPSDSLNNNPNLELSTLELTTEAELDSRCMYPSKGQTCQCRLL